MIPFDWKTQYNFTYLNTNLRPFRSGGMVFLLDDSSGPSFSRLSFKEALYDRNFLLYWMPWDFTMNVNSFANNGFGTVHEFLL